MSSGRAVSFTTTTATTARHSLLPLLHHNGLESKAVSIATQHQIGAERGTRLGEEPFHKSNTKHCAMHFVSGLRLCIPARAGPSTPLLLGSKSISFRSLMQCERKGERCLRSDFTKKCVHHTLYSPSSGTQGRQRSRDASARIQESILVLPTAERQTLDVPGKVYWALLRSQRDEAVLVCGYGRQERLREGFEQLGFKQMESQALSLFPKQCPGGGQQSQGCF